MMEPLKSIWGDIANLRHERSLFINILCPQYSPEKRRPAKRHFPSPRQSSSMSSHTRSDEDKERLGHHQAHLLYIYIYEFDSNNLDDKKAGLFYLHPKSIINGLYVQSMVSRPQRTANKMRYVIVMGCTLCTCRHILNRN